MPADEPVVSMVGARVGCCLHSPLEDGVARRGVTGWRNARQHSPRGGDVSFSDCPKFDRLQGGQEEEADFYLGLDE